MGAGNLPPIIRKDSPGGPLFTSAGIALRAIDTDPAFKLGSTRLEREQQWLDGQIHYYNLDLQTEDSIRRLLRSKGEILPQDDPRAKVYPQGETEQRVTHNV